MENDKRLPLGLAGIAVAKSFADPVGHYSRPDVARLLLNRSTPGPYPRFPACMHRFGRTGAWDATERTFGLGYVPDVHAFEQWAKSHPGHLAIFDGFLQIVETFGDSLSLRLWHEVTALPNDGCEFEYIACHSDTGLLGYA